MSNVEFSNELFFTKIKMVEEDNDDKYIVINQTDNIKNQKHKVLLQNSELISLYSKLKDNNFLRQSFKLNLFNEDREKFITSLKLLTSSLNLMLNDDAKKQSLEILEQLGLEFRICTECSNLMCEGYCIEGGVEYYCSDSCLYKNISQQMFTELFNNGDGDTYYTEWY